MKILCIGHLTYDTTISMDEYPVENEKYRLTKKVECGGGPASNAAYLLGKWGMNTYFAGVAGNDIQGKRAKKEFDSVKVNTNYLELNDEVETDSSYIIANDNNGSRTILSVSSNRKEHPLSLNIEDKYDVIEFDGDELEAALKVIKKNPNAIKIIDAGNLRESTKKLSYLMDYLVCSHDFAEDVTNKKMDYKKIDTIIDIYKDLKKEFKNNIIITLESFGTFTEIDGEYKIIPSIKAKSIDSTGAGDIFHGAFTYFIANGFSLEASILLSNITGALSVEKLGSRYSVPELQEVINKYKEISND